MIPIIPHITIEIQKKQLKEENTLKENLLDN